MMAGPIPLDRKCYDTLIEGNLVEREVEITIDSYERVVTIKAPRGTAYVEFLKAATLCIINKEGIKP